MKFLYLSFIFPPLAGAEPRHNLSVIRRLRERGFEPVIITSPRDYPEAKDLALESLVPEDLRTVRVAWPRHATNKVLARGRQILRVPRNPLEFGGAARLYQAAASEMQARPVSFIYTVHGIGAAHLAGLKLKAATRLPWVAEFRDPWFHNVVARTYLEDFSWRWWSRANLALTRRRTLAVVKNADLIVVESPMHGEYLVRDFAADANRIVPYGMGYEPEYFRGNPALPVEFTRRPVIGFVGYIYYGYEQVVRNMVRALAELERRGHAFTLLSVGDSAGVFAKCAQEEHLESHVPIGRVGLGTALALMQKMDFGFVCRSPDDICNINSKLWEYLAAKLYILGVVPPEGAMARLMAEGNCGRVLPYDVEGMVRGLEQELLDYAAGTRKPPPPEFTQRFSAERMVDALAERLRLMCANASGTASSPQP